MAESTLKHRQIMRHKQQQSTAMDDTFTRLYEQHKTQVYRYVLARVGNVQDAHDITSQTFLAAYRNYSSYSQKQPFLHWLMGIARNKTSDFYRQSRDEIALSAAQSFPHPAPLPEESVEKTLQFEAVAEALKTLTPERQEALALRIFAGLSTAEAAAVMEKSKAAVAMLVNRGIQDLQRKLAWKGAE